MTTLKLLLFAEILALKFNFMNSVPSLEVNQWNCVNGVTLETPCLFIVDVKSYLNNTVECYVVFNSRNNGTALFVTQMISIAPSYLFWCPHFKLKFANTDANKINAKCGDVVYPVSLVLENFTKVHLYYSNNGKIDVQTIIRLTMKLLAGE